VKAPGRRTYVLKHVDLSADGRSWVPQSICAMTASAPRAERHGQWSCAKASFDHWCGGFDGLAEIDGIVFARCRDVSAAEIDAAMLAECGRIEDVDPDD
jgi:hypothetical protein